MAIGNAVGKTGHRGGREGPQSVSDVELAPTGRDMASLAVLAERAPVHVRAQVTTDAIGRELEIGRRLHLVARFANQALMRSDQREFRLPRMIEAPASPAVRVVAVAASRSQPPLMKILVAFFTGNRRILVRGRPMAFLAGDRGM